MIRWEVRVQNCELGMWHMSAYLLALPPLKEPGREPKRVPEVSITNCAGILNNCTPRHSKLSAIDLTSKSIYECLELVVESKMTRICAL